MFEKPSPPSRGLQAASLAAFGTVLAVLGGIAFAAQDKYTVQVPNGLALSEIRGYEDWQTVAISDAFVGQPDEAFRVILGNPTMIDAYRAGIPSNGKQFPDGSKMVKVVWKPKRNALAPFPVNVPDTLMEVEFMEKDSKRFSDSGGWGYAEFLHDTASDTFTPKGNNAKCGATCHTIAKARDYVFTDYAKR